MRALLTYMNIHEGTNISYGQFWALLRFSVRHVTRFRPIAFRDEV